MCLHIISQGCVKKAKTVLGLSTGGDDIWQIMYWQTYGRAKRGQRKIPLAFRKWGNHTNDNTGNTKVDYFQGYLQNYDKILFLLFAHDIPILLEDNYNFQFLWNMQMPLDGGL